MSVTVFTLDSWQCSAHLLDSMPRSADLRGAFLMALGPNAFSMPSYMARGSGGELNVLAEVKQIVVGAGSSNPLDVASGLPERNE